MSDVKNEFKIVVLGDAAVGKTSLLNRRLTDKFIPTEKPTVGVDLRAFSITNKALYEKAGLKTQSGISVAETKENNFMYWDLGGQNRYDQLRASYFQGAHGIMLCFSLNDNGSFFENSNKDRSIGKFLLELIHFFGKNEVKNIPILLVGTKCDLYSTITDEVIVDITKEIYDSGMNLISYSKEARKDLKIFGHFSRGSDCYQRHEASLYIKTSSLTGLNVNMAFCIMEMAVKDQRIANFIDLRAEFGEDKIIRRRSKILEEIRKFQQ